MEYMFRVAGFIFCIGCMFLLEMVTPPTTWYSSRIAGNQNTNSNFAARGDGRTEVTESSAQHRFFPRRSSLDDQRREQERAWRVILEPWRKKRLERAKRRRRARLSRVCFHTRYHAYAKAAGSVPIVSEELLVPEGGWNSSSRCNSNDAESGTTIGFFSHSVQTCTRSMQACSHSVQTSTHSVDADSRTAQTSTHSVQASSHTVQAAPRSGSVASEHGPVAPQSETRNGQANCRNILIVCGVFQQHLAWRWSEASRNQQR